jgi:peptide/nickel transport system substrate-binding protein
LWNTSNSTDTAFFPNYTHKNPVMAAINQDKRFRHALSLAIDREEINQAIFFGRGTISQPTALPGTRFYKDSYAKAFAQYDVDEANRLLDEMGLKWDAQKKWRLRPDGETLSYIVIGGPAEGPVQRVSEIVIQQWEKIGVKATYKLQDWGLTHSFHQTGESDMFAFLVDKSTEYGLVSDGRGISWYDFSDGNRYFTSVLLPGGNQNFDFPAEFSSSKYPFSEILRLKKLSAELEMTLDEAKRLEIIDEIFKSQAENLWVIGTVYGPKPITVANNLRNVRETGIWGDGLKHMSAYHPEQFFLKQ